MVNQWRIRRFQDGETEFEENLVDVSVVDAVNRFGRKATAYIDDSSGERKGKYRRGTGIEFQVTSDAPEPEPLAINDTETQSVNNDETETYSDITVGGTLNVGGTLDVASPEYTTRFRGFVIEQGEMDRNGRDMLELEVYSFDYFLRQDTIERDFSGENYFDALQEIIEDFTPVVWNPDNVSVVNNDTLTRGYRGEKVDEALDEISSKSANEEYGVNDDLEFFFRPREFGNAPRDVDNSQWLDYDFPEESKQTVNEVQLFYGEGGDAGSVIVDRASDKQELEDNLGLSGPGVLRKEITYEDITTESDAREKAEQVLNQKEVVQRGEVTTYQLYDAEPGDVINVTITAQDIDQEFRIAEIEYRWSDDATVLQLVERTDKDDERLVEITDTLNRVERRNADRDAIATRFVDTETRGLIQAEIRIGYFEFSEARFRGGFGGREKNELAINDTETQSVNNGETETYSDITVGGTLNVGGTLDAGTVEYTPRPNGSLGFGRAEPGLSVDGRFVASETDSRVTTALLDAIRDGWRGNGNPTINTIAVGSDGSTPSRTDTELGNELDTISATATPSGDTLARWDGTVEFGNEQILREFGLKNTVGDLKSRLLVSAFTLPAERDLGIAYRLRVSNDADITGVQTTAGQTTVRDIIADNAPNLPTDIAFGSNDTMPTESDTALGTELTTIPIDSYENRQTGVVEVIARLGDSVLTGETIAETGIKSNGTLLTRVTFAEFVKEAGQAVENRERDRWENA